MKNYEIEALKIIDDNFYSSVEANEYRLEEAIEDGETTYTYDENLEGYDFELRIELSEDADPKLLNEEEAMDYLLEVLPEKDEEESETKEYEAQVKAFFSKFDSDTADILRENYNHHGVIWSFLNPEADCDSNEQQAVKLALNASKRHSQNVTINGVEMNYDEACEITAEHDDHNAYLELRAQIKY